MLHKSCPVKIKAAGEQDGAPEGVFEAIVSVFGNIDSYGDVVVKGAFTDTLAEWLGSGDPIPVYWSHQMSDPDMNLGHVLEAKETDAGLWVKAQLDLESPKAQQVYRLMKGRRVTQFSFAYDIDEGAWIDSKEDGSHYELRKLKLYEVGPTPIGANQETDLLAVKSAGEHVRRFTEQVKAGRVLSAKNETTLQSAHDQLVEAAKQIEDVLAAVGGQEEDQEKASTSEPVNAEEPTRVKAEEPTRVVPVDRLAAELTLLELKGISL